MNPTRTAVIGAGAWGTALAIHVARLGQDVGLWCYEKELAQRMLSQRENPLFLPGVALPSTIQPTSRLAEAVEGCTAALFVVPSAYARPVARDLAHHLKGNVPLIAATKGIEVSSLAFPLEVLADELKRDAGLAVLSGPSFAVELAQGHPTAVVVAATDEALPRRLQQRFASPTLRIYTSTDPTGVQCAAALKNVIAIAAGIADSLGMGLNAQAALITRGLAELARLGRALGGEPDTFSGLAGLGDLVLTCTGTLSRNRQLGQRLGRGQSLDEALAGQTTVAEGVPATRSARELSQRHGVTMPIVDELHRIMFEGGDPTRALSRLMQRPLTGEIETHVPGGPS